jgi:hypothetical protein
MFAAKMHNAIAAPQSATGSSRRSYLAASAYPHPAGAFCPKRR